MFTGNPDDRSARARLVGVPASEDGPLRLHLDYVAPRVAVLTVTGEVDMATTPRWAALLWPRLRSELRAIVIDLSGVTFLGVAGLELLAQAGAVASQQDIELHVVTGTRTVDRAMEAVGLTSALLCHASVASAREALTALRNGTDDAGTGERPLRSVTSAPMTPTGGAR